MKCTILQTCPRLQEPYAKFVLILLGEYHLQSNDGRVHVAQYIIFDHVQLKTLSVQFWLTLAKDAIQVEDNV